MIKVYTGRHVTYPLFNPSLIKIAFSRRIWEKYSNIKFNKNPCSGSRVVPCGRTDGQTNITKLILALRNFANAPTILIYTMLYGHGDNGEVRFKEWDLGNVQRLLNTY